MALYIDPVFDPRPFARRAPFTRQWEAAHLSADTVEELRAFVAARGYPRSYLHRPGSYDFHYDLYGPYLADALTDDRVRKLSRRAYVRRLQTKRRNR